MKRFLMITVLAAALMALLASAALAAPSLQAGTGTDTATPTTGTCPCDGTGRGWGDGESRGMGMRGRPDWAGQTDEVATLLGMTQDEIQAERQAGKSLAKIAADKDVSEEQLIETILAAKKEALAQAVTDGKLTQAQADQMIERMTEQVKIMVERATTGPAADRGQGMGRSTGRGGMGMRGGRGNR